MSILNNTDTQVNNKIYDKMAEFIESVFNVFNLINDKADSKKDKRLKMISIVILNYVKKLANQYYVDLKDFNHPETINLIPIFEYITHNNIELYDFKKIDINDLDVKKETDIEKFVLTHIYYITQS